MSFYIFPTEADAVLGLGLVNDAYEAYVVSNGHGEMVDGSLYFYYPKSSGVIDPYTKTDTWAEITQYQEGFGFPEPDMDLGITIPNLTILQSVTPISDGNEDDWW